MSTVQWVAVGVKSGGVAGIAYSYNGTTWTETASASNVFNSTVFTVVHNGVLWVAGGYPNASYSSLGYSYDGINWTASSSGKSILAFCIGVDYGNGMFVAVGSGTTYSIAYSYDGIIWTGCASNTFFGNASIYGYSVKYANSMWVAGGTGSISSNLIGYSYNGINWTLANATQLNSAVFGIDYNGTNWVAVGTNANNNASVSYSTNGITWTNANSANTLSATRAVKWNGSKFIAVGSGSSRITSTNGINWTSFTPADSNSGLGIEYNASTGLWVISQDYNGVAAIQYSTDGTTWTKVSNIFVGGGARGASYARPPPYTVGTAPTITSITNGYFSFNVNFTAGTGASPAPTTYYYSLDGGSTYTNANTTTSPMLITGVNIATTYNVAIIANNLAGNTAASNISIGFIPYPCFLEGSKILSFSPETYQDEYVPVENLRRGDLIKTSLSGYKAISFIGRATLNNPASDPDHKNRLYRFKKSISSKMTEDLCITGEHCTLRRNVTEEQLFQIRDHMGDVYVTEKRIRCPACLDERATPYKDDSPVKIWHFALENDNAYHNYGVYANGLLVESCSIEHLLKRSNMELV